MDAETREIRQVRSHRRSAARRNAVMVLVTWLRTRVFPVLGSVLGLGCMAVAAFTLGATIGLFVLAGILWILEWRVRG
jgi:hypothetical protein